MVKFDKQIKRRERTRRQDDEAQVCRCSNAGVTMTTDGGTMQEEGVEGSYITAASALEGVLCAHTLTHAGI